MELIYKYKTDTFFTAIHQMDNRIKKLQASGIANKEDVLHLLKIIKSEINKNEHCHLIVNAGGLESFPWSLRKEIYEEASGWFTDHRLDHLYVTAPTAFIKMVGFLVGKFYKTIRHSYYLSDEEAFQNASMRIEKGGDQLSFSSVEKVLSSRKSSKNLTLKVLEILEDNNELILVDKNIVILDVKSLRDPKLPDLIYHSLVTIENPLLIVDLSSIKEIPDNTYSENPQIEQVRKLCSNIYIKLPSLLKFLVGQHHKSDFSGISYIDSISETTFQLLQGNSNPGISIFEKKRKIPFDETSFSDLSREGIEHAFLNYLEEADKKSDYIEGQLDQISTILSKITWDNRSGKKEIPLPKDGDLFYDLYQTIHILQKDMMEIGEQIQTTSEQMETQVAERTHAIKKTESNLRALLDNYQNPIFLLDDHFKVIDSNYSFQKFLNIAYQVDVKIGDYFFEPFEENLVSVWKNRFERCLTGERQDYTESYEIEGQQYYFEIRLFPIKHELNISGIGVFANNVTDLNTSKLILEEQNNSLLKLNNELDSFIYRSSHDLRAPVSSMMGLINLARMVEDPEEKERCMVLMERSVNKMENFIKDIIDHTKNTKLELEPEEIELTEFMKDITGEFEHLDPMNLVEFKINHKGLERFVSDRYRLITVLNNIISNAIKYKDDSKEPKITLGVNVENNYAEFTISDNGQGIKEDYQPKIFDMFFRANEQSNGTGLGLYIVKDIVDKLDGTISVQSEYGSGTKVIINIPELELDRDKQEA